MAQRYGKIWYPLENNPDVLNPYMRTLGVTHPKASFCDVYGLSEELQRMVPHPVAAVLFVYPISSASEKLHNELVIQQEAEVEQFMKESRIVYLKQFVPNACGTIAMLHALLNNYESLGEVAENSILARFHTATEDTTPVALGKLAENDVDLEKTHLLAAASGITENQPLEAVIDLHYVCYIHSSGRCVELDGRKKHPILHEACTDSHSFLTAASKAIGSVMNVNPDAIEYSITALCLE